MGLRKLEAHNVLGPVVKKDEAFGSDCSSCSRPRVESAGMVLKHNNEKAMAAWKYLEVGSN